MIYHTPCIRHVEHAVQPQCAMNTHGLFIITFAHPKCHSTNPYKAAWPVTFFELPTRSFTLWPFRSSSRTSGHGLPNAPPPLLLLRRPGTPQGQHLRPPVLAPASARLLPPRRVRCQFALGKQQRIPPSGMWRLIQSLVVYSVVAPYSTTFYLMLFSVKAS